MIEVERSVTIVNRLGLHARPAAEFVKVASRYKANVTITKDGLEVNGKSIMGVMTLAAECGSTVRLYARGVDAEAAVDALQKVLAREFGDI